MKNSESNSHSSPAITLVCPCYNEQEVLPDFIESVSSVLDKVNQSYELLFINDGSTDRTLQTLMSMKKRYPEIRVINLSRNFGKEAALTAGLDFAQGQVIIPIDADLQDPPELIHDFINKWKEGYDVVLAKRADRSSDSKAKRITANVFYKFHNRIANVSIPENVGDYRLMTRKVVDALKEMPENQRFMKGVFSWVGFNTTVIEYKREKRAAGRTSFNGWRLWNLALDGVTSFSTIPLRIWLYIGALLSMASFIYGTLIILKTIFLGVDVPGYASTLTVVLFIGGIQLVGIGILGEYIGRMYIESKRRPVYLLDDEH